MSVRRKPSGQHPSNGISRAPRSDASGTSRRQNDAPSSAARESRRDDVQSSDQAREPQQPSVRSPQAPELSPARMRQVLERMSDGHYDRPEVLQEVVRRLMSDL